MNQRAQLRALAATPAVRDRSRREGEALREVVERERAATQACADDLAQGLTFASRAIAHRGRGRERAQLRALIHARRTPVTFM